MIHNDGTVIIHTEIPFTLLNSLLVSTIKLTARKGANIIPRVITTVLIFGFQ